MNEVKRLLSFVRRAVDDYEMIDEGDRIAVGVSGGKDSLALLSALARLRLFYPKKFEVVAITVDMGFEGADYCGVQALCDELKVKYIIERTEIAKIIFDVRRESNPCSLCAKMRRGSLHAAAVNAGCNKVALGHHYDDAVETFMMNLFFEGRIGCFSPKSYLSNRRITLIRPLIYAQEKDVRYFARRQALPVTESLCPEDHATEREKMKQLLHTLERDNEGLRHRIFHAMCKSEVDGFALHGRYPDAGKLSDNE
ncbi:MAG: tRNA 2-thiocytidine(32) synthetase TtcA [Clostridia bacterium]|nr:tRNA 2-thiocytidine(32) synthetase TtcA [Clostridia bacterium]